MIETTNALHKRKSFVLVRRFLNTAGLMFTLERAIEGRSYKKIAECCPWVILLRSITLIDIKTRR